MPAPLPALPETNTSICIVIPDSAEWRQLYVGALVLLQKWWYYDVTSAEDAEDVVQRVQQCAYESGIDYEACMFDCEDLLECLLNDEDVRNAVAQISLESVTAQLDSTVNESIANGDLSGGQSVSCNDDNLFGMVTGFVDLINNLAVDLIEQLSAGANTTGRAGDMIEAIPVIGELPFDDILQMVESFMDDLSQNYDANYTVALRDDYRCDLFCLAKDNDCILTFQIAFDYFSAELGEEITTLNLDDLLEFFTQGIFSGVEIVHAFHAFVTGLMLFGASILNMDSVKIARLMGAIWNDPDSDWSILCADCGWTHTFDFTVNDGGFVPHNIWSGSPHAVYVNGVGWQTQDIAVTGGDFRRVCVIKREFVEASLSEVSMVYNLTKGTTSSTLQTATAINNNMRLATVVQASNPTTFENSVTGDGQINMVLASEQADDLTALVSSSARTTAVYTGSATITSCTIKGTGTNPFN